MLYSWRNGRVVGGWLRRLALRRRRSSEYWSRHIMKEGGWVGGGSKEEGIARYHPPPVVASYQKQSDRPRPSPLPTVTLGPLLLIDTRTHASNVHQSGVERRTEWSRDSSSSIIKFTSNSVVNGPPIRSIFSSCSLPCLLLLFKISARNS